MTPALADHFFRHEYGKLVATLSRLAGVEHIEAVEDAVQSALMKALDFWTQSGLPENPTAWLFKVAQNELIGELRKNQNRQRLLDQNLESLVSTHSVNSSDSTSFDTNSAELLSYELLSYDFEDDLLRILFICCDPKIPAESQLVFALKTLCGFSVPEIALRLFTTDANVYKRLKRARDKQKENAELLTELTSDQQTKRLPAVITILYLMFTEGHLSSHAELAIRRELCSEAIRLGSILAKHPIGNTSETAALLALMHLHFARMSSRQTSSGGLLLLEEQDRSLWDQEHIHLGLQWLGSSATGDVFSRYHAEAGIAAEHCLAPSFHETRWHKVIECYEMLENIAPSPIHTLNRAVALAESQGAEAGLTLLKEMQPPSWLESSYLWSAVQADLHRRCRNLDLAKHFRNLALKKAPSQAVKDLLERRLWTG